MTSRTDRAPGPLADFAAELRRVKRECDNPTDGAIAEKMRCSRSAVSAYVNAHRFPDWEATEAFVRACGGRPERLRPLWRRTADALDALQHGGTARQVVGEAMLSAHWYRTNPEFYGAAAERVRSARASVRVTYTRCEPPTHYTTPASAEYFDAILDWAREGSDGRYVQRVIGVPEPAGSPLPEMLDWARRHHDDTCGIKNYQARVLRWGADADGLNMALIDDNVVFLAFSGGAQEKLNGFSVEDPTFMSYFSGYFDQLWGALPRLGSYLARPTAG
ncbi:helix-turn-helix domain-containing protein [Streptomyces sp. NPDC050161]|uniref:helix-turn-helix domain-containing protein n=1 Tax=Streptomyces sp. NPDC050161 TaxID=3365604 RepID=UPI0037AAD423